MTRLIAPDSWRPVGVAELEPAAWDTVRDCAGHQVVVAGPGAGKTELLAQRAAFLLQTGAIAGGRHILALAFKKDAAANLGERVHRRCGSELGERFNSLTIDAFAKSLVVRFGAALPADQRPPRDFELVPERDQRLLERMCNGIRKATANIALTSTEPARAASAVARRSVGNPDFMKRVGIGWECWPIPDRRRNFRLGSEESAIQWATPFAWAEALQRHPCVVSWDMLKRMAICLVTGNPRILRALRRTYAHVFIDEFQDLTSLQLELVFACFPPGEARLTAVGDDRQRIMSFAGAVRDIFSFAIKQYGAIRRELVRNYRADRRLVEIQRSIMRALDGSALPPEASRADDTGTGQCVVWTFPDSDAEARVIARTVALMVADGVPAHRICLLTRQRVADFAPSLIYALSREGVAARIEDQYQEVTKDAVARLLRALFAVAVRQRSPEEFSFLSDCLENEIRWSDRHPDLAEHIRRAAGALKQRLDSLPVSGAALSEALLETAAALFGGRSRIGGYARPSRTELDTTATADALGALLAESREGVSSWGEALDRLDGRNVVPIMTVHKSKGLEYHAVIFVGLEDDSWWAFRREPDEESRTFFVAFSRAEQRVLFTFSGSRFAPNGRALPQARDNIRPLYELLQEAGVETVENPSLEVCRQFACNSYTP